MGGKDFIPHQIIARKGTKMRWLHKIYGGFWLLLFSCSTQGIETNPYVPNVPFNYQLNLRLPGNNALNFAGGGMLIPGIGLNGVMVFNLNGNTFLAWEATCPNHAVQSCSTLAIDGVLAVCSCEDYQYSLATGQLLNAATTTKTPYSLLFYRIEKRGDALLISN